MRKSIILYASMILAMFVGGSVALAAVSSNSNPVSIPASGQATPYPATTDVSDLSGPITDLNVTLHGVSHTFPDDVAALLVGPRGQKVMLVSDAGGGQDLNGVDLTLDDEATRSLPDGAGTRITTGSYRPTQGATSARKVPSSLPSPAPAGPYDGALSVFDGADPNGTYELYVFDDGPGDGGQIASGFSLDITAGATDPPTDRRPDLGMAHLQDLSIDTESEPGRKLLRFDSIVVNVGDGPFELYGDREANPSGDMSTKQRIFDDAGGSRYVDTPATMYFGGDGHNHWHVRNLEDFELARLDNGNKVGTGAKHGFCFYDNFHYGSDEPEYYRQATGSCAGGTSATQTMMGMSPGWGDIYHSGLPDQYIDITGLANGRYRLTAVADADNWFVEGNDNNNVSWMNIRISGDSVSVARFGPAANPI